MKQYGGYTLSELDMMLPYEKEIHLGLLIEKIKKENESIQNSRSKGI